MSEFPRDIYFPVHNLPDPPRNGDPEGVCAEDTYQKITMYGVGWEFTRMSGHRQYLRGWHCYGCRTTFFVSDPMTQLFHDCMKDRGSPFQF